MNNFQELFLQPGRTSLSRDAPLRILTATLYSLDTSKVSPYKAGVHLQTQNHFGALSLKICRWLEIVESSKIIVRIFKRNKVL